MVPGVLIIVTATCINLLGDWLQERAERQAVQR
jgi:ABC-type dipeptide/oligopeptide/nickel transport system permease subunit